MGLPLDHVHEPVEGYRDSLTRRVDGLFDRLGDRIVWRRNWFVHPNPALFQPSRPAEGDPVVPAANALRSLHLRSERQTLRRLPRSGQVLFTIRTQQTTRDEPLGSSSWRSGFRRFLDLAPDEVVAHRGIVSAQREELRLSLSDPASVE